MPLITDKFGKASISSDVAIATTVKTARLAGVLVLEANDLSKYATDTPVFVVTYKKTTDPLTGAVSISQLRSWKALVNTGANTLTNLTIQPGYADDIGNAVGDYIECIPTSAWENALVDGILTSLNPDGTLKTSAVQAALNIANTPSVGWNIMAQALTVTGTLGRNEFTGTFNGDVTGILSPGMKLLVPRTATLPTQCMQFNKASSQYASRTTLSGMTHTAAQTTEAWFYMNSRASNTSASTIMMRRDAALANGWWVEVDNYGRLAFTYEVSGAYTVKTIMEAVPLKDWHHVAVTITAATQTFNIYFDGQLVAMVATSGTGTTLGQAGTLSLGAANVAATPGNYFDGYLAEVRVWSVAQSAATIQANMNLSLTGGEANLVALYQGNGNFNDKTTNANHLTAVNGAVATTLLSSLPTSYQNANEYLFVHKVGAYAAGVTPVTLWGGLDGHLPSTGLGTVQYSNAKAPFGFPNSKKRWTLRYHVGNTYAGATSGVWNAPLGYFNTAPTGEWNLKAQFAYQINGVQLYGVISQSSTTATEPDLSLRDYVGAGGQRLTSQMMSKPMSFSAPQNLYFLGQSASTWDLRGDQQATDYTTQATPQTSWIELESAYA